jgi:hypothetical protein
MTTMTPMATNTTSPSLINTLTGHFNRLTKFVSNKVKSMNTNQTPTTIVSSTSIPASTPSSAPSLLSNSKQNFTGGKSCKKHKKGGKKTTKTQKNTKNHKKQNTKKQHKNKKTKIVTRK